MSDARLLRRGLLENGYRELEIKGEHAVAIGVVPPIPKILSTAFWRLKPWSKASLLTADPVSQLSLPGEESLTLTRQQGSQGRDEGRKAACSAWKSVKRFSDKTHEKTSTRECALQFRAFEGSSRVAASNVPDMGNL